jgi:rhamnosyltransferase
MRAVEMIAGIVYVSAPFQSSRALRLSRIAPPENVRAAIVVHVFYPEIWEEILAVRAALPPRSPIIVTAPPAQAAFVAKLTAGDPLVEIVETPNRGRDIAPFLHVLQTGRLDRFDAVLKIHTKKSPHLRQGDLRRRMFFTALAGSRGIVASVLNQFADSSVGIVGPGVYFRTAPVYWMGNRLRVEALAKRLEMPAALGFFEGSMFWVRPTALQLLRSLALEAVDFEAEAAQLDGTLHHAVERLFPIAAAAAGYGTYSLGGRLLVSPSKPAQTVMA